MRPQPVTSQGKYAYRCCFHLHGIDKLARKPLQTNHRHSRRQLSLVSTSSHGIGQFIQRDQVVVDLDEQDAQQQQEQVFEQFCEQALGWVLEWVLGWVLEQALGWVLEQAKGGSLLLDVLATVHVQLPQRLLLPRLDVNILKHGNQMTQLSLVGLLNSG
ncbi:Hypothetical_protein [Hexamita inflata]|uniref:Hypothetical_protein n=1 Tax=Hexamita inflata TaxID=28002 RepID=A0AA86PY41_9EUKA|nr:Hypothetical protein HINF_LOCUS35841 [Hexamita inflata]